jgi:hypothetical protein
VSYPHHFPLDDVGNCGYGRYLRFEFIDYGVPYQAKVVAKDIFLKI